jgi:hypothetical protein
MLSVTSTILFLIFIIPMTIDMIAIIRSNLKYIPGLEDQKQRLRLNRKRKQRIIILFILLPICMGLLFVLNHLLTK